jgi:hypothetical protein
MGYSSLKGRGVAQRRVIPAVSGDLAAAFETVGLADSQCQTKAARAEVRSQKSGIKNQEAGSKKQETIIRGQNTEGKRQYPGVPCPL